jgi:hypothetical protein
MEHPVPDFHHELADAMQKARLPQGKPGFSCY